jgi:hypothetical protein
VSQAGVFPILALIGRPASGKSEILDYLRRVSPRKRHPRLLSIRGHRVPYAVFENEDDLTTAGGPRLGARLAQVLGSLKFQNG